MDILLHILWSVRQKFGMTGLDMISNWLLPLSTSNLLEKHSGQTPPWETNQQCACNAVIKIHLGELPAIILMIDDYLVLCFHNKIQVDTSVTEIMVSLMTHNTPPLRIGSTEVQRLLLRPQSWYQFLSQEQVVYDNVFVMVTPQNHSAQRLYSWAEQC